MLAKYSNRHHRKIQGSCWQTIDESWVKFSSQSIFENKTLLKHSFSLSMAVSTNNSRTNDNYNKDLRAWVSSHTEKVADPWFKAFAK